MYKLYDSVTLVQADFDADPNLLNSVGNRFVQCTFDAGGAGITGINFSQATFESTCEMSAAVFDKCNFAAINTAILDSTGLDPVVDAASVTDSNIVTVLPEQLVDAPIRSGGELSLSQAQITGRPHVEDVPVDTGTLL